MGTKLPDIDILLSGSGNTVLIRIADHSTLNYRADHAALLTVAALLTHAVPTACLPYAETAPGQVKIELSDGEDAEDVQISVQGALEGAGYMAMINDVIS